MADRISFDPAKRARALLERGLDFADAPKVFAGSTFTMEDRRVAYPEPRFQTYGLLDGRMVMLVWIETGDTRRIISLRKCNAREQARFGERVGRSR